MSFYILRHTLTFLFLSLSHPTTMVFNEPIEYVSAGSNGDFDLHRANNQKILVIKPLKSFGETDMIVLTKNQHYQFKLKEVPQNGDQNKSHSLVNVFEGEIDRSYVKKIETDLLKILEGDASVWFINKTNKPLLVNGIEVTREGYFSKGAPILVNGERVLY